MSNYVTNILTINGTEDQVAKVRDFIKGSNGESISFQSFFPMPKNLKGKRNVSYKYGGKTIPVPDWMDWRFKHWGTKWDAEPIRDDAVDAPNRILFNTPDLTCFEAILGLSVLFPEVTFNVIFSDATPELYCGEYTFTGGKMTEYVCYDGLRNTDIGDISVDQKMEYFFRTHEFARDEWKKDENGMWVSLYDEE